MVDRDGAGLPPPHVPAKHGAAPRFLPLSPPKVSGPGPLSFCPPCEPSPPPSSTLLPPPPSLSIAPPRRFALPPSPRFPSPTASPTPLSPPATPPRRAGTVLPLQPSPLS